MPGQAAAILQGIALLIIVALMVVGFTNWRADELGRAYLRRRASIDGTSAPDEERVSRTVRDDGAMPSSEIHQNFLLDLGPLVKELALKAKAEHESAEPGNAKDFAAGRLMAFHELVSLMQQQSDAFGIDRAAIALDAIDPERDLL